MTGNDYGLGMSISVSLDSAQFTTGLANINRSMKTAKSDAMAQIAQYDALGDSMGAMSARLKGLNDQYALSAKKQEELKRKHREAVATYGEASAKAQKYAYQLNMTTRDMARLEVKIREGENAIEEFSREMANSQKISSKFGKALDNVSDKLDNMSQKMEGFSKNAGLMGAALGGVGLAAGKMASDTEKSLNKLVNSFGASGKEAEHLKESAKEVWSEGFGENLTEAADAVQLVKQNLTDLNDVDLSEATKKIKLLADTYNSDVSEVSRGVNAMMKGFGLSFDEASDMVARGAQLGLNRSNELFDNLAEYVPLFKSMGYDGEEMFNILIGGMQEGAYNLDYVNDAYKEFGIRIKDGSKTTADAMSGMSKSTQDLWKKMLEGKATSGEVASAIVNDLKGMDDQVAAGQDGVALFGTKWEDLESTVMYATQNGTNYIGDYTGAMDKMVENTEETFDVRFKKAMRTAQEAMLPFGETMLDIAEKYLPKIEKGVDHIVGAWEKLDEKTQSNVAKWGVGIAGALVVMGGAAMMVAALAKMIRDMKTVAGMAATIGRKGWGYGDGEGLSGGKKKRRGRNGRNNDDDDNDNNGSRGNSRSNNDTPERETRSSRRNTAKMDKVRSLTKTAGKIALPATLITGAGLTYMDYKNDEISEEEKSKRIGGNIGGTLGGVAGGAAGGALIGSVVPGVGTAIGALVGGVLGMAFGEKAGEKAGQLFNKAFGDKAESVKQEYVRMKQDKVFQKGIEIDFKIKGVKEETEKALTSYNTLYSKANEKFKLVSLEQRVISKGTMNTLMKDQQALTKKTLGEIDRKEKREIQRVQNSSVLSKQEKAQGIKIIQEKYAQQRKDTSAGENRIKSILNQAKNEKRALTSTEVKLIERIRKEGYNRNRAATARDEKELSRIKKHESEKRKLNSVKEYNDLIARAKKQYKEEVSTAKKTANKKISDAKYARDVLGTMSQEQYEKVVRNARKEKNESIAHSEEKRDKVVSKATAQKKRVSEEAEAQKKKAVKAAEEQKDRAIAAADAEKRKVEEKANAKATGVERAWKSLANKTVGAVNKLMKMLGFKKQFDTPYPGLGSTPVKTGSVGGHVPQYAKGTYMGKHKGGPALVGEEGYELAYTPSGGMGLVGAYGEQVVNLPKGSAVLPHEKTKRLLGGGSDGRAVLQKYNFPAFAKGTGDDNFFESTVKFAKKAWGGLTSVKDNVIGMASKGFGALWDTVKDKIPYNENGGLLPKDEVMNLIKNIAKSPVQNAIDAMLKFKEEEEALQSSNFDWDGELEKDPNKIGPGGATQGLMKYVYKIYKDNIANRFKVRGIGGYSNRNMVGGSSKSMHSYGRAIDIFSTPAEMARIAEASRNLPLLQYVIYNKKWAKPGSGWANYMRPGRNPHTDHVHIDFKPPTKSNLAALVGDDVSVGKVSGNYASIINKYASQYKVPAALIAGIIKQESNFNPKARSGAGAAGLMQLMPATARAMGVNNPYDPDQSIRGGAKYIKQMLNMFPNVKLALAAYNAGPGNVRKYGGVPPFAETQNYVRKVYSNYQAYQRKGFENGGLITREQLAWVGEGNRPEAIIPLQKAKRGRALQLLKQTAHVLGAEVVENKNNNVRVESSNTQETNGIIAQLVAQNNALMETLINVVQNKDLNIGDKAIFEANKRQLEKENRRTNYQLGY